MSTLNNSTTQTLAFEELRSSPEKPYTHTAIFLHGLLGKGRNYRRLSESLISSLSADWRVVLVDLRNHANSTDIETLVPPHDMFNTAKDVSDLIKSRGWDWPDVVMGHSMGANVAFQFAQSCARGDYGPSAVSPKQVWDLDSLPGENSYENMLLLLKAVETIPSPLPSREWVVNYLNGLGCPPAISKWISNLRKNSGDQEIWDYNLEGATQMFNSLRETSHWPLLEHPPQGMEIAIVVAEKSEFWEPEIIQQIESLASKKGNGSEGKVSVHYLPNSAHWVHVDNPEGLLEIITPKMNSLSA